MKAAVISLGSVSSQWTLAEMRKLFDEVEELNLKFIEIVLGERQPTVLYQGKPISKYDCIYAKGSFRYNQLLRALTTSLCKDAYMPVKASAFTVGHDKLLTQLKLEYHRIPTPKTYLSATVDAAKKILEKIHYPIVMKFPEGTQGKGVMFADSLSSANSLLDALVAMRQPFIIQEYIDTGGVDIRALVVGNKVVAAMKRKAIPGEKRANIHAGALGEGVVLDTKTQKLAVSTAKAVGCEICGVDILEGVKGPMVIEVNLSPGLQGVTKATGINVAGKIAKFLFEQTRTIVDSTNAVKAKDIVRDAGNNGEKGMSEIISNLDFRADRILLSEMVSKASKFSEEDEVTITASKGSIEIKKFSLEGLSDDNGKSTE
ncbi:MAG: RimK family alpha-L-glutamate ligase [archaeon]